MAIIHGLLTWPKDFQLQPLLPLSQSMNSNLTHALDGLNTRYRALGKSARLILLIFAGLLLLAISALTLRPAPLTDLAEGSHLRKADFYPLWNKGELVVLMRHVERCDHSTNPCLEQADGITVKGQHVAVQVGQAFQNLGLNQTNIYNSPLRRTEQTASYAFNRTTTGQEWLINCRKSMLDDVLKHKLDQHNMILVTHSECIAALEQSLKVSGASSLDYGSSLIISINPDDHSAKVLGYIDAQDWGKVLAKRP